MYSWEIDELLRKNNYEISAHTYLEMIKDSTQLTRIKYNPYSNTFDMWDEHGMCWSFRVYLVDENF